MSDRKHEGDRYWCTEGCGFQEKNHRCEQWSQMLRIPVAAIAELRRKGSASRE